MFFKTDDGFYVDADTGVLVSWVHHDTETFPGFAEVPIKESYAVTWSNSDGPINRRHLSAAEFSRLKEILDF